MSHQFSSSFFAAVAVLCAVLVLVIGIASSFFITQHQISDAKSQSAQQSVQFEMHLCQTLNTLRAEKPPAGDPKTNPSRAFDQEQHDALAQLAVDLGCPAITAAK